MQIYCLEEEFGFGCRTFFTSASQAIAAGREWSENNFYGWVSITRFKIGKGLTPGFLVAVLNGDQDVEVWAEEEKVISTFHPSCWNVEDRLSIDPETWAAKAVEFYDGPKSYFPGSIESNVDIKGEALDFGFNDKQVKEVVRAVNRLL